MDPIFTTPLSTSSQAYLKHSYGNLLFPLGENLEGNVSLRGQLIHCLQPLQWSCEACWAGIRTHFLGPWSANYGLRAPMLLFGP